MKRMNGLTSTDSTAHSRNAVGEAVLMGTPSEKDERLSVHQRTSVQAPDANVRGVSATPRAKWGWRCGEVPEVKWRDVREGVVEE